MIKCQMIPFLIIISLISILSCKPKAVEDKKLSLSDQFAKTTSPAELKALLLQVEKKHYELRATAALRSKEYGPYSQEFRDANNAVFVYDDESLDLVKKIFERDGYPSKKNVGEVALVPWAIVRHHYHIPTKESLRPIFLKAWQNADISAKEYLMLIQDIYISKEKPEFNPNINLSDSAKIKIISDSLAYHDLGY